MYAAPQPQTEDDDRLEIAVAEVVAASNGDLRAAVRALIVENRNLIKSVSHAFMRLCGLTCGGIHETSEPAFVRDG
jgi:hypothetical protein